MTTADRKALALLYLQKAAGAGTDDILIRNLKAKGALTGQTLTPTMEAAGRYLSNIGGRPKTLGLLGLGLSAGTAAALAKKYYDRKAQRVSLEQARG